jgi:hypothetical protein
VVAGAWGADRACGLRRGLRTGPTMSRPPCSPNRAADVRGTSAPAHGLGDDRALAAGAGGAADHAALGEGGQSLSARWSELEHGSA